MPYWLRGDARLPELASCSFTISPPDLVRLTSPSSDVHLHTSGHDTAMEPDPYSTWMCIARSEDFCVHLSQEHERLLAHDLIGASLATMLNLSSDARALAPLGLAAARETPSDASITAAQLVEALQTINCPSIRIRAKGRDEIERTLAGSSVLERRDLVWFFRPEVITRGITLLRGPRNSSVRTFPCLGQLGAGFGMVLVPLPARADGIHSVRISTTLTDVLSCLEGAIGRFWCPIEDEMSYNGAIAMAMAWQAQIARRSACDLYGAAVEVSVSAGTEDEAREALRQSDLLRWSHLLQGRVTGAVIETRTISKDAYLRHLERAFSVARRRRRRMSRFNEAMATRNMMRLGFELGYLGQLDRRTALEGSAPPSV